MQKKFDKAVENFNKKRFQESLDDLNSIKIDDTNKVKILTYISLNFIQLKQYENAIKILIDLKNYNENKLLTYKNLAFCYLASNKIEQAIKIFEEGINLFPNDLDLLINLAYVYRNTARPSVAIKILLGKYNNFSKLTLFLNTLGASYLEDENIKEAIMYSERVLILEPNNYQALNNLGSSYQKIEKYDLSLKYFQNAIKVNPASPVAYCNRGVVYYYMMKFDLALQDFQKTIEIDQNYSSAYLYKSFIELSKNQFIEGWQNYEHRWSKLKTRLHTNLPLWDGKIFNVNILVFGEQALGEQILFSTLLKEIEAKFKKVFIFMDERLVQIYQENFQNFNFISKSTNINQLDIDYQIPLISLAKYFRNSVKSFNTFTPLNLKFNRIVQNDKIKCGISWKSFNPVIGERKSISLKDLLPILEMDDFEYYNIQYSNEIKEIEKFQKDFKIKIKDIPKIDKFNDFYNFSNYLKNLDFIITISNTTAHLAGILGIPTFLLLPRNIGNIWYWNNHVNNQSLWYPSIKIFRQNKDGDWPNVIENLKSFLIKDFKV